MTVTRNLFVRARVADWEKHYIDSKAKEAGISESEFVRRAAMDKDVTVLPGVDELVRELRYQGNNLNQLTVMARQGRIRVRLVDEIPFSPYIDDQIIFLKKGQGPAQGHAAHIHLLRKIRLRGKLAARRIDTVLYHGIQPVIYFYMF